MAGDPTRMVRREAVCGGAGDFLLDAVRRTDADVYVTSDLRHHPASEFLEQGGPALVDVAHWAAEWTWLPVVAAKVTEALGDRWRPGSARGARTHGHSTSTIRDTQEKSAESRPRRPVALLDLQELDSRADLLRHQRETLPELAEIAALTATRAEIDGRRRDAQISVDDLTAEQSKVDADVEQVKTRRKRDQDRMAQGLIANPKDLQRMQGERVVAPADHQPRGRRARGDGPPRGRREGLDSLTQGVADADQRLAELSSARDARTQELDRELQGVAADRGPTVSGIPEDLLALYDKLRASKNGVAVGALRARECSGCRLSLDPTELAAIRSAPADEVIRHEECQRILIRTPESGL